LSMKLYGLAMVLAVVSIGGLAGCGSSATKTTSSTDTMYVTSRVPGKVYGYYANFNDGSLTNIGGTPFLAQPNANAIVIDPTKSFAYVANAGDGTAAGNVESYSLDLSGAMLQIGLTKVGLSPVALAMDSKGKFLFVANRDSNSIAVFAVGANASLTAVPNAVTIPTPVALAVTPGNDILFVADRSEGYVWALQIGASGVLTTSANLPPVVSGSSPSGLAMNAAGTFLYVANRDSENVSGFTIASGGGQIAGTLTPIAGSPYATGLGPVAGAVDPSGQFLYVTDQNSNQVSGYRIRAGTGTLTPLSNSPYSAGAGPDYVAISPTNKFLYVSNSGAASISAYKIDPTSGNLIPASGAVPTGASPAGIAFGR
jgi:6-phosphogluconolactonase